MKKKFLAFGLAACMVLGSAFSALAETVSSVEIPTGFAANTGEEKLSGDFDVTYEFHNASQDTTSAWFNFIVEIWGAKFGATLRADAYGWSYNESTKVDAEPAAEGEWTLAWSGQPNWDEFKEKMADADVVVNIKRAGNNISLKYDIAAGDTTYAINGEISAYALPEELSMHITGEKVNLTNVTFTVNPAEEDSSEETPSEEQPSSGSSPSGGDEETPNPGENPTPKPSEPDSSEDNNNPNPGEDETTAPSPDGGNEEAVKATVVTAEAAKAVAEAAKVTNADGKVLDVVLTATPVEDTAAVAGLIAENADLAKAEVKAFAVLDLELKVGDKKVTYLDNKINVTIPMDKIFTDIKADDTIAVYRVDKDMAFSFLGMAKVTADKTITFATDHFTQYAFVVVGNAEALKDVKVVEYKDVDPEATPDVAVKDIPVKADASGKPSDKPTGDTTPVMPLVVLAVVALGGVVAVAASKKRA